MTAPRPAAVGLQPVDRSCGCRRRLVAQAVQLTGVDVGPVAGRRDAALLRVLGTGHVDDATHRQAHRPGEVQVALVVRRHGHDRAGAVVGQHVVARPDRDLLPGDRVGRGDAQVDAGLGPVGGQPVDVGGLADLDQVVLQRLRAVGVHDVRGQRGVGRHHHERRAVQRVGTRRVDVDLALAVSGVQGERDVGALGAADPVALRGDDAVGPRLLQLVQAVQQLLGVVGDLEVPLGQLLLGHLRPAPLADAVDDLLVGQHRLVLRAPVDRAVLAVGQSPLEELQEQPLRPAVVLRVAGVERARPVERGGVLLARLDRLGDVGAGVGVGVLVVADRRVLRGQAEGVEAHRVQHLVAALPPVARHHVVQREHLGVTHVQVAARVGEHRQRVALLARARVVGAELVELLPDPLPLRLGGGDVVRRALLRRGLLRPGVLLMACPRCWVCGSGMKKPLAWRGGRASVLVGGGLDQRG